MYKKCAVIKRLAREYVLNSAVNNKKTKGGWVPSTGHPPFLLHDTTFNGLLSRGLYMLVLYRDAFPYDGGKGRPHQRCCYK